MFDHETKPRWVHAKLTVEHMGVKITIHEDGKVTLHKAVNSEEFDEITVPASVIIKAMTALRLTRRAE